MKNSFLKRLSILFCAVLICVSAFPLALAAETAETESNDGLTDEIITISPAPEEPDEVVTSARSKYKVTLSKTSFTFDGKTKTPSVTVKSPSGKQLRKNRDYTVKYSKGRKNVGKYAVKVTIKGKNPQTLKAYFYILPSKTAKIEASCTKDSVFANWSKVRGADGYKVCLFKDKKLVKELFTSKCSSKLESLEKFTEYKLTVTAFSKIDGERKLSNLSKSVSVATSTDAPKLEKGLPLDKVNVASLKWNFQPGADGYVVYMAKGKNGKFEKVSTLDGKFMRWCLIKCEKTETLSFKIKAYKNIGNEKSYSPFSNTVTF